MSHHRRHTSHFEWSTEFVNLADIQKQILTNAEVLFPAHSDLRVITGKLSQTARYAAVVSRDDATPGPNATGAAYRIVAQGPAEADRRLAVMKLLDDIERRIATEIMDAR
ncbi:hypothetical protein CERZMDRAFT_93510 [Cercospora zeae-maydis SCOH1-5]|uniref:Uncharacterized protein n=1 Tax=Cercospora zeae-maydis SCOH1-5 TaxID=717836 RepID=A0A6A6FRY4_9PEZI|nr:hypothetical protein CERZMDRAFT_93510 [Cercospora zeae-maydis SCOH1-5]